MILLSSSADCKCNRILYYLKKIGYCQAPGPGLDKPGPQPSQPGHQLGQT